MNAFRGLAVAVLGFLAVLAVPVGGQTAAPAPTEALNPKLPRLFLVGDLASGPQASLQAATIFDSAHLNVVASSSDGETIRAYIHSGAWEKLLSQMKPGDFVLIEFTPVGISADDRAAATRTLQGIGDGTFDYFDPGTQKLELVHSYGWYLREMVVDVINHGASPILCSAPVAAQNSVVAPSDSESTSDAWTRAIATEQRIPFVDLTTPTRPAANGHPRLDAATLRAGLEALKPDPLAPFLVQAKH
jgi:hypothetical protein